MVISLISLILWILWLCPALRPHMIKLTVNPQLQPRTYTFDKTFVIIGTEGADLTLPQEKLEPAHIKITEQNNRFIAINLANDPFAMLNGLPFGKKVIRTNDILEIGTTRVHFEGSAAPSSPYSEAAAVDTSHTLPTLLEKIIEHSGERDARAPSTSTYCPPSLGSVCQAPAEENEKEELDLDKEMRQLDAWLQETSSLPEKEQEVVMPLFCEGQELGYDDSYKEDSVSIENPLQDFSLSTEISPPPSPPPPLSRPLYKQTIKDLYFTDADDEFPSKDSAAFSSPLSSVEEGKIDWHTAWITLVAIISTLIIVALLLYANASGKTEDEEIKAAESTSDVAMALAYAQFNNIVPQNQNWSDPEFLKNNLTAVLSAEFPLLAQFDSHGQFSNSPYLLRIYTASDLSNFLVIAQPAPSLLHWLIPKSTIMVYSKDMELRKTTDLKSLNRILVNHTLDGPVASDVASVVKKAEIIPLSALSKKPHLGFAPPVLTLIRAGAENRIYNAPRYYNFGEAIMRKAVMLSDNQENSNEVLLLKHEIEALARYPDFIMYSSQGIQAAIQAQKALALFDPSANFLIAYLQYNSQGFVQNSHLLIDDGSREMPPSDEHLPKIDRTAIHKILATQQRNSKNESPADSSAADITHPLFFQLSALTASRQQILKPLSLQMISLLESENQYPMENFAENLKELSHQYQQANIEQNTRIIKGIAKLYQGYASMPLSDFMHYVKSTGMESLAQQGLEQLALESSPSIAEETIALQIQKIKDSLTLQELEEAVLNANRLFTLANIPSPNRVMVLQNDVKAEALDKINSFIFPPREPDSSSYYTQEDSPRLARILAAAWLRDQEEIDYYISEFELFLSRQPMQRSLVEQAPTEEIEPELTFKTKSKPVWSPGRIWSKAPEDAAVVF